MRDKWPPNSRDLNPFDHHVRGVMLEMYHSHSPKPTNITELKIILKTISSDLPQGAMDDAVLSFNNNFRHALKQLVGISNMLCKPLLVKVTFRFNLRFKQLLFQLVSQAYLSCG